jgi:hypothetical protein
MPLAGIRLGDCGTLTIVANKCSIVRNAPCRMNMHPPRCPDPCPLLLPRSELHHRRPHVLPRRRTHVALRWCVWRCTCEEQGPRLPEQPQSLHRLGSSRWAKWLSTGPLPGLWYGSGGGGADAEGRWKSRSSLFHVCMELGNSKSELGFLCAFDSAVRQELWILSFSQRVSPDVEGCWIHCFSTVELCRRGR